MEVGAVDAVAVMVAAAAKVSVVEGVWAEAKRAAVERAALPAVVVGDEECQLAELVVHVVAVAMVAVAMAMVAGQVDALELEGQGGVAKEVEAEAAAAEVKVAAGVVAHTEAVGAALAPNSA